MEINYEKKSKNQEQEINSQVLEFKQKVKIMEMQIIEEISEKNASNVEKNAKIESLKKKLKQNEILNEKLKNNNKFLVNSMEKLEGHKSRIEMQFVDMKKSHEENLIEVRSSYLREKFATKSEEKFNIFTDKKKWNENEEEDSTGKLSLHKELFGSRNYNERKSDKSSNKSDSNRFFNDNNERISLNKELFGNKINDESQLSHFSNAFKNKSSSSESINNDMKISQSCFERNSIFYKKKNNEGNLEKENSTQNKSSQTSFVIEFGFNNNSGNFSIASSGKGKNSSCRESPRKKNGKLSNFSKLKKNSIKNDLGNIKQIVDKQKSVENDLFERKKLFSFAGENFKESNVKSSEINKEYYVEEENLNEILLKNQNSSKNLIKESKSNKTINCENENNDNFFINHSEVKKIKSKAFELKDIRKRKISNFMQNIKKNSLSKSEVNKDELNSLDKNLEILKLTDSNDNINNNNVNKQNNDNSYYYDKNNILSSNNLENNEIALENIYKGKSKNNTEINSKNMRKLSFNEKIEKIKEKCSIAIKKASIDSANEGKISERLKKNHLDDNSIKGNKLFIKEDLYSNQSHFNEKSNDKKFKVENNITKEESSGDLKNNNSKIVKTESIPITKKEEKIYEDKFFLRKIEGDKITIIDKIHPLNNKEKNNIFKLEDNNKINHIKKRDLFRKNLENHSKKVFQIEIDENNTKINQNNTPKIDEKKNSKIVSMEFFSPNQQMRNLPKKNSSEMMNRSMTEINNSNIYKNNSNNSKSYNKKKKTGVRRNENEFSLYLSQLNNSTFFNSVMEVNKEDEDNSDFSLGPEEINIIDNLCSKEEKNSILFNEQNSESK